MSRALLRWRAPLLAVLVCVLSVARPASAADANSHIRVVEPQVAAMIETGSQESATFRAVTEQLESQPLLVFVRCLKPHEQRASAAGLVFLANTPNYRYVRVFLRCELPASVTLPLLAHEFQHALEVARTDNVVDAVTLRAHYERAGYHSSSDDRAPSFETEAAIDVQRRVTIDLAHAQRAHASPIVGHALE